MSTDSHRGPGQQAPRDVDQETWAAANEGERVMLLALGDLLPQDHVEDPVKHLRAIHVSALAKLVPEMGADEVERIIAEAVHVEERRIEIRCEVLERAIRAHRAKVGTS